MSVKKDPAAMYVAGYNAGIRKARGALDKDLECIYGMLCISLHEMGVEDDAILLVVQDIQERWIKCSEDADTEGVRRIKDMVLEKTGIDLCQIFGFEENENG